MAFLDRYDAGKKLVPLLKKFENAPNTIVLGLPRGGVITAFEVARGLNLPLDITCPRKIGAPFNPEYAIGAITETGDRYMDAKVIERLNIPESYIDHAVQVEKLTAQKRLQAYRQGKPARVLKDRQVILVDDGLATGSTMRAAIKTVKSEGASKVILAVPVSPPETFEEIKQQVDEAYCLITPAFFMAVGEFYQNFRPTEDEEVIQLLKQ